MKKIFTLLLTVVAMATAMSAAAQSQDISIRVKKWNASTEKYVSYNRVEATLVKNSDGTWTISDFLNSGYPVSFKCEDPIVGNYNEVTIVSETTQTWPYDEGYEDYYDLLNGNGDYLDLIVYNSSNEAEWIFYPHTFQGTYSGKYYPNLYRYDISAGATNEYYFYMDVYGYDSEDEYQSYYIYFYFNELAIEDNEGEEEEVVDPNDPTNGINEVIASGAEAPVEYYNLNGVRVDNPTNGLYIRKQGSEVKKVVL